VVKPGDLIADYKVIDFAGSGGMGAVYKIEHILTRRIEAMKVLPISLGSGPEEAERFKREIQIHARLNHPNIATLYNAIHDGNSIALIMEYVDGVSLQHLLEQGPLRLKTAVDYAAQILDALSYAHEHGVIHRDVSPSNIIITPDGAAKLTDFGLARSATDLRLTTSGVAVGSRWYMSPEQVRAVDALDARTDVYAMGAVLHEMLTGRKLFEASGSFEVMRAQMETVPLPPSTHNPEVPAALDAVVAKALEKDPAARFHSAGEFRLALGNAFGGVLASAKSRGSSNAAGGRILPAQWSSLWSQGRHARLAAVLALAAIAVVCATLWWPRRAPAVSKTNAPQNVASQTAPAITPAPSPVGPVAPAALTGPMPSEPEPELVRSAAPARRAGKQRLDAATRSRAENAPTVTPSSALAAPDFSTPPANSGPASASAEAPQPPQAPAEVLNVPAALEPASQTPEADAPPPAGNRFVKALRRLNPFHKHSGDNSKPPEDRD
jgi:serine/threonine protein kinase